jgi:hypothetical protein
VVWGGGDVCKPEAVDRRRNISFRLAFLSTLHAHYRSALATLHNPISFIIVLAHLPKVALNYISAPNPARFYKQSTATLPSIPRRREKYGLLRYQHNNTQSSKITS